MLIADTRYTEFERSIPVQIKIKDDMDDITTTSQFCTILIGTI